LARQIRIMASNSRQIWQIAAGDFGRFYGDVFLKYGVALIGPGDTGPWSLERSTVKDLQAVRSFASEVQQGDIFLLRIRRRRIHAIGIVASDYVYLSQFDDVNGWDLQHALRVHWCRLPKEYEFSSDVFGPNPRRFSRSYLEEVRKYADAFVNSPPIAWQEAPLPSLPSEEAALEIVPQELQALVSQAADLSLLYWDQKRFGSLPSEAETVAHFVIPFLKALGWQTENIAVEWHNVDVALFNQLPRNPENCAFIIEAKQLGSGVEGALEQAQNYLKNLGTLQDVIVTDGVRYRLYSGQKNFEPTGYANLARLKQSATILFDTLRPILRTREGV
jgi:hypothetical protein